MSTPNPNSKPEKKAWGCSLGCLVWIAMIVVVSIAEKDEKKVGGKGTRHVVGSTMTMKVDPDQDSLDGRFGVPEIEVSLAGFAAGTLKPRSVEVLGEKDWGEVIEIKRVGLARGLVPIGAGRKDISFRVKIELPTILELVAKSGTIEVRGKVKYPYATYGKDKFDTKFKDFSASKAIHFVASEADIKPPKSTLDRIGSGLAGVAILLTVFGLIQWFLISRKRGPTGAPHSRPSGTYASAPIYKRFHHYHPLFVSLFAMFAKLAKADGHVSSEEIAAVRAFMDATHLDAEKQKTAIEIFNSAKDDDTDIRVIAATYRDGDPDQGSRLMVYQVLVDVAMADGSLAPAEDAMLKALPASLGIPESCYDRFVAGWAKTHSSNSLDVAYELLGCKPTATDAEVTEAYREAAKIYHPDTFASKGLPKEISDLAANKFAEYTEAYEKIKAARA